MEFLIVGALIGIICTFLGIFVMISMENQKKRALLQQTITRALVELSENKDYLGQLMLHLKPKYEIAGYQELEKKFVTLKEQGPDRVFFIKDDELLQLKNSAEFMNLMDIKTNIEINNVAIRFQYISKTLREHEDLSAIAVDDYKTIYHTYEMIDSLFDNLSGVLEKLKK